jgi:trehalose 6-phosphate synthase/phosphatase
VPPLTPERLARSAVVAIGDDRTDEDLFVSLPAEAITVRVGPGPTRARYRLEGTSAVRAVLRLLADAGVSSGAGTWPAPAPR